MTSSQILLIKNIPREGPGLLEAVLNEHKIPFTIVDLERGDPFPSLDAYCALVVLGGPDSANDTTPKMQNELAYIREALERGMPYLGICLGLQTLVKAAGGRVVKNPVPEIGFRDPEGELFTVELTEEGKSDPLFEGLNSVFHVFQLHGETVELRPSANTQNAAVQNPPPVQNGSSEPLPMVLLGTGKFCHNQIVRVGQNVYGLQCHFELTEEMFEHWLREDPDLFKMDAQKLRVDFAAIREDYNSVGRKLLENFLKVASLT